MIISGDDPVSRGAQRFEVFTGAGKRREWPPEVKASIVAECYSGREGVSAVARRHGLDPSQVYQAAEKGACLEVTLLIPGSLRLMLKGSGCAAVMNGARGCSRT